MSCLQEYTEISTGSAVVALSGLKAGVSVTFGSRELGWLCCQVLLGSLGCSCRGPALLPYRVLGLSLCSSAFLFLSASPAPTSFSSSLGVISLSKPTLLGKLNEDIFLL